MTYSHSHFPCPSRPRATKTHRNAGAAAGFHIPMPNRLLRLSALATLLVALAAGATAATPSAHAQVTVGIGQQTPDMFNSKYWRALKMPSVRYITPWDSVSSPGALQAVDNWLRAASAHGGRVMIGFRGSFDPKLGRRLPTNTEYARAFRAFHKHYPWIREYIPWNETNHPTALTSSRPGRAAAYFNIVSRYCKGCKVVGGDVLDISNMESWIARYKRFTHPQPKIWGLHNYHDANALKSTGVRRLMAVTKGTIWMTETGGVVKMRVGSGATLDARNYGLRRAAQATRHVLDLAKISPRIGRIYLYHWQAPTTFTSWDSALMTPAMRPRPAYETLLAWLKKYRRTGLAR